MENLRYNSPRQNESPDSHTDSPHSPSGASTEVMTVEWRAALRQPPERDGTLLQTEQPPDRRPFRPGFVGGQLTT